MLIHKGKELTRIKAKTAGKNQSEVDGFYEDPDGCQFFIKKPADKKELFTELLAGLVLKQFMQYGLVDTIYHASLICADVIDFGDGEYGLIQDVAAFDELFKVINTGYADNSDRSPLTEMLSGPAKYPLLTQKGEYFGLSTALMFSLLLGANSVHSGNIVVLHPQKKSTIKSKQLARLDWGDAFRHFLIPANNEDILNPYEYHGAFNFKGISKGFFLNYKRISGLFPAIAEKGRRLFTALESNGIHFTDILKGAIAQIPADLLDPTIKTQLAAYMGSKTLADASFGEEGDYANFADEMAAVFEQRMGHIKQLNNLAAADEQLIHQSIVAYESVTLAMDAQDDFPSLMHAWQTKIQELEIDFELDGVSLPNLATIFNEYVDALAQQAQLGKLWGEAQSRGQCNIFAPYYEGDFQQKFGYAFVKQCHESMILRRLFMLDAKLNTTRLKVYEDVTVAYAKATGPDTVWAQMDRLLSTGLHVISSVHQIQRLRNSGDAEAYAELVAQQKYEFKNTIKAFNAAKQLVEGQFSLVSTEALTVNHGTGFYPIDEAALQAMSGAQLVTICLEEVNFAEVSVLLQHIMQSDVLWERMLEAYSLEPFSSRNDGPDKKIETLLRLRSMVKRWLPLEKSLEDQRDAVEVITTENSELRTRLQSAQQQLGETQFLLEESTASAAVKIQQMQQAILAKETDIAELHVNRDGLVAQLEALDRDNRRLVQASASGKAQWSSLQDTLLKEQLRVQALQQKIESLTVSASSVPDVEQVNQSVAAEEKYQALLSQNRLVEARLRRMEPLITVVVAIEIAANRELESGSTVHTHARELIQGMRCAINHYTTASEPEATALQHFKDQSRKVLDEHKGPLEQHRGMVHLIGNLLLAIALLGVGYAAAAGVNKLITGSFTFFNDSHSRTEAHKLEKALSEVFPARGG